MRPPSFVPLVLCLAAVTACEPSGDPDEAFADELAGDGSAEQPIAGITCPATYALCTGSGSAHAAMIRVGATPTSAGEIAQTFRVAQAGLADKVRLKLRLVRKLPAGTPARLVVSVRALAAGLVPTAAGADLASSAVPVSTLATGGEHEFTLAPANGSSGALEAGTDYALVVRAEAPASGAILFGVASHVLDALANAGAQRRSTREGSGGPFVAAGVDLSFSLTLQAVTALGSMPIPPAEYIELSEAVNPANPATWDLTGNYTGIVSTGTWDATHKAIRTDGLASTYVDTRWKPGSGAKTACMWKRMYDAANIAGDYGLDGYQAIGNYFYYGSYYGGWYFYSGSNGGTATGQTPPGPQLNEWHFYCLSSTGAGGSTAMYVAVPGDATPVLRRSQAANGTDAGHTGETWGMLYGRLDTANHPSKAFYGGMVHFNAALTASQVNQVFAATKVRYPGHGGTR